METEQKEQAEQSPVFVSDIYLAERYSVARQTIWRWARIGAIPKPALRVGRTTRWSLEQLKQFEEANQ